jgi:hypothetical protein
MYSKLWGKMTCCPVQYLSGIVNVHIPLNFRTEVVMEPCWSQIATNRAHPDTEGLMTITS